MSSFKVSVEQNSKTIICRGKFENFKHYSEISKKIYDNGKPFINPSDKFKLMFEKDSPFIPELVSFGIFDEESYKLFSKKLQGRGEEKYRFYIEKVKELPKLEKKKYDELLNDALQKYWDITLKDISSDLNLKKLENSKQKFEKLLEEKNKKEEELKKQNKNENIICSNCFEKEFCGARYMCSECDNYNLCQKCENLLHEEEIHDRDHVLIKINKNIKDDILQYNNVIGGYRKEFTNVEENFELEIVVVNNGKNDLEKCCILPVRYGSEYIKCQAKIITESIKRGKNAKILLEAKLPEKTGYFEGYFRMFTPSGLPFGNIISIKVINGN